MTVTISFIPSVPPHDNIPYLAGREWRGEYTYAVCATVFILLTIFNHQAEAHLLQLTSVPRGR